MLKGLFRREWGGVSKWGVPWSTLGPWSAGETSSLGSKGAREEIYPLWPMAMGKGTFKGLVNICREKEQKIELSGKLQTANRQGGSLGERPLDISTLPLSYLWPVFPPAGWGSQEQEPCWSSTCDSAPLAQSRVEKGRLCIWRGKSRTFSTYLHTNFRFSTAISTKPI